MDLFDSNEWKFTDDQKRYKKTIEDGRTYKFLTGLNVEFDEVRGWILRKTSLLSINDVFS